MSVTPFICLNRAVQTVTLEAMSLQIGICHMRTLDVLYCPGELPMGTAVQTLKLGVGGCTRCMNSSTIPMQVPGPHPTRS